MDPEEDDEDVRRTAWRLLVRRARGVPDIVSEDVAFDDATPWSAIAEAGATGRLFELERLLARLGGDFRAVAEATATQLPNGRGKEDVDLVEQVIRAILLFVRNHPFQADCGCYFK